MWLTRGGGKKRCCVEPGRQGSCKSAGGCPSWLQRKLQNRPVIFSQRDWYQWRRNGYVGEKSPLLNVKRRQSWSLRCCIVGGCDEAIMCEVHSHEGSVG